MTDTHKILVCRNRDVFARPAIKHRERCDWTLDTDNGSYDTDCGEKFQFTDGAGPIEHGMRWCGYCGGKLRERKVKADAR